MDFETVQLDDTTDLLLTSPSVQALKKRTIRNASASGTWNYQCDFCGIGYHTMSSVTSHRCRKHKTDKEKVFHCFRCGELFQNSAAVMQHALIHQEDTPFPCDKCGLRFISEKMLNRHNAGAHRALPEAQRHVLLHEFVDESVVASVSPSTSKDQIMDFTEVTVSVNYVEENVTRKWTPDVFLGGGNWEYQCDYCGIGYHTMGSVTSHRCRKHKKPEDQDFKCYECGEVFETSKEVMRHALEHQTEMPFNCDTCGLSFSTNNQLFRHTVGAHGAHRDSGNRNVLKFAEQSFNDSGMKTLEELLQLKESPSPVNERETDEKNEISIMNTRKKVLNVKNLDMYDPSPNEQKPSRKRTARFSSGGGNWEYQCQYCGIGYHTTGSISSHKWRKHEVPQNYVLKCFKCDETFKSSIEVMKHALIHITDTPFNCEICGQNFTSHLILRRHTVGAHGSHRVQVETISVSPYQDEDAVDGSEEMSQSESVPGPSSTENQNQPGPSNAIDRLPDARYDMKIAPRIKPEVIEIEIETERNLVVSQEVSNSDNNESNESQITTIPLPVAIYQHALHDKNDLMVAWIQDLEVHTVTSVCMNASQSLLCVRLNEDIFNYSDHMKKLIKGNQPQSLNFTVIEDDDEATQWTLFTFCGRGLPTGIKNKLFKSYEMVEKVFVDYALNEQKTLSHLVQCSGEQKDLFSLFRHQMKSTLVGCNHVDNE